MNNKSIVLGETQRGASDGTKIDDLEIHVQGQITSFMDKTHKIWGANIFNRSEP